MLDNGCFSGCESNTSSPSEGVTKSCASGDGDAICGRVNEDSCCTDSTLCNSTPAYCGAGCQSGRCLSSLLISAPLSSKALTTSVTLERFSSIPPLTLITSPFSTTRTPIYVISSSISEPSSTFPANTTTAASHPSLLVTADGSCGANHNGTVCGDWPQGACCSMFSFCGNT
jgi:hypothetical protein